MFKSSFNVKPSVEPSDRWTQSHRSSPSSLLQTVCYLVVLNVGRRAAVLYLGTLAILQDLLVCVFGGEEASTSSVQVLKEHRERGKHQHHCRGNSRSG